MRWGPKTFNNFAQKKNCYSGSKGGPSVNEVSFRTRPHCNVHNTLGVDTLHKYRSKMKMRHNLYEVPVS
jgi:hypothetical protein